MSGVALLGLALLGAAAVGVATTEVPAEPERPNVLWVIIDDLRTALPQQLLAGAGDSANLTDPMPRLSQLASDGGVVFRHAYCQVAVCAPSRTSFMSGRRPDALHIWSWESNFRQSLGTAAVSLPQHFKNNGYVALGSGKTFQPNFPPGYDAPRSWSGDEVGLPYLPLAKDHCGCWTPPPPTGVAALTTALAPWAANPSGAKLSECGAPAGTADDELFDHAVASYAIEAMQLAALRLARPFFVAAGLYRPHLPWRVPPHLDGAFATAGAALPRAARRAPAGTPPIAWTDESFDQIVTRAEGPERNKGYISPVSAATARAARAAYSAAAAWSDEQLGRMPRPCTMLLTVNRSC